VWHERKGWRRVVKRCFTAISLAVLILALVACGRIPRTTQVSIPSTTALVYLPFEKLDIRPAYDYGAYSNFGMQVHLMSDWTSTPDVLDMVPNDRDPLRRNRADLNRVDFAKCSVVFALFGSPATEGPGLDIQRIWLEGRNLYVEVRVDLDNPVTYGKTATGYRIPFSAAKVSKDILPSGGSLSITLLDQDGQTMAVNTCFLPKDTGLLTFPVSFFPVQSQEYPQASYPLSKIDGAIVLDDGYLWVADGFSDNRYIVIWPAGWEVRLDDGELVVANDKFNRRFSVRNAQLLFGGEVDAATAEKFMGSPLPAGCPGPYWLVSEVYRFIV
jgi:hypothetical protein